MTIDLISCHRVEVHLGSYANVVQMKCPTVTRNEGWVDIDTCIATEIGRLWHQGVTTLNSCCGHGQFDAWVVVDAGCDESMAVLGYEHVVVPSGVRSYFLRTGTSVSPQPRLIGHGIGGPLKAMRPSDVRCGPSEHATSVRVGGGTDG